MRSPVTLRQNLLQSGQSILKEGISEAVRFEVRYPTGAPHEIELQGTVAVLGRDPSCDLVLNDSKCSRRHAVLEAGAQGIAIRDAGSANGTYVNGKKIERASLREGDVIRLGEVQLTVLPEEMPGTVVMGPEDLAEMGVAGPSTIPPRAAAPAPPPPAHAVPPPRAPAPPPAPPPRPAPPPIERPAPIARPAPPSRPPAPAPPPAPRAQPTPERPRPAPRSEYGYSGSIPRPLTVTVLGILWGFSALLYPAAGLGWLVAGGLKGAAAGLALALAFFLTMLCALMAFGLFSLSPWARIAQIVVAALPGVGLCGPYFLASAAIIVYMLRPETKILFSGRREFRDLSPDEAETVRNGAPEGIFTGAIIGGVFVGFFLSALLSFFAGPAVGALPSMLRARTAANEANAVGRVRTVISAQEYFKGGTCQTGYADLEGLLRPATVIPNYPSGGATFLSADFAQAELAGYRFELTVEDPVPPAEGCPLRSFRRYQFAATCLDDAGRSFLGRPDGIIHVAQGRPATPDDPPLQ